MSSLSECIGDNDLGGDNDGDLDLDFDLDIDIDLLGTDGDCDLSLCCSTFFLYY